MKVNLGKTRVMVNGGITKDDLSKYNVGPCVVCSFGVKAISVLCVHGGKWSHGICAGVKMVATVFKQFCLQEM